MFLTYVKHIMITSATKELICSNKTHKMLIKALLSLTLIGTLSNSYAQINPVDTLKPVHEVEGISEYVLENGLKIILAPDQSQPNTTVNMTYMVGARHENYGQTGMAHLLEHMLFRGTPNMPDALAEFSRRGLQANGTTNADRTNYYASFAADPETLKWYINWQADSMVNASITQEDLDSEMTVVRNEMERGENSPFQVLMQKMMASAYQWHNYGKTTIGARSDVENVDIHQLRKFYKTYYQPDNAVLIVSGQFDEKETLQYIYEAFAVLPKPERKLPPEYTKEPVQDGERKVTLKRQGGSPLIGALYHIPAAATPEYIALDLGVAVLGDTPSGRLYTNLVREGLSTQVFAFAASMAQPGYALFGAQLEPGMDQQKALEALKSTIDEIKKKPISQTELDRVRNQWLTGWSRIFADPVQLASALSESQSEGDWRLFFWMRDTVESIKLDKVQKAISRYLVPDNRTIGVYIPTEKPVRAPASDYPEVNELLKDYKGKGKNEQVGSFDTSPLAINNATEISEIALSSGTIETALLPKPTRGNRVEARLSLRFGNENSLKGQRYAANAVAALLDRGTSSMSRQDIKDRFDALQTSVGFSAGTGSITVSITSVRKHLSDALTLVADILKNANFPEEELAEYKRISNTAIADAMADPQALASRKLARHANNWPENDIRYVPDFEESKDHINALTREQLLAFHDEFYGIANVTFSAVGDFDAKQVKQAITEGFQNWKSSPGYERVSSPYHEVEPKMFNIETPGKANAFYMASMPLEIQDTSDDFAALYMADYLLGRSETSRLWNRVRTQEGLSYNVRSSLDLSSYEPNGSWTIYAIFAPENRERLETAINEEIDKVLEEGFSEDEVQQGVKALLNYRRLARSRDSVLASTWLHYLNTERSFEWSEEIDERLQELSADDVNNALRKVFDPARLSISIAGDFKEKAN